MPYLKNRTMQDLIVSAFGFVASMATAVVLFLAEEHLGFSFYTMSLWFVIPVGAFGSGLVAAGGYYLGSILFGHRPSGLLLVNMVLVSLSTFYLIYWLSYNAMEIDGKHVSDYVPFSTYLDIRLTHQTMTVSRYGQQMGTPVELGNWGYATAALQVIGFAFGGVAAFAYLVSLSYCERCSKYLKAKAEQIRYYPENLPENFSETVTGILASIDGDRFQEAFDSHGAFGSDQYPKGGYLRSQLEWKQCPACKINWLGFSAQKLAGDDWRDIKDGSHARFSQSELRSK